MTIEPPTQFSDDDLPTVEAVVAQKRREAEARLQKAVSLTTPDPTLRETDTTSPKAPAQDVTTGAQEPSEAAAPGEGSPEALEEEAGQQGAFNPETGEINWDCPCLGGMAHGPCGEEFKAAFSCFVYSKEEPKGMDCIDKFQHMQDCFREHPEVYGDELRDDEDAEAEAQAQAPTEGEGAPEAATTRTAAAAADTTKPAVAEKAMSYADVAASGPKQTYEEKAAPQPPQIVSDESTASTSSLVDVDSPSVRTVPSDYNEQDVQTDTQAAREEREELEDAAAARARAEADLAAKKKASRAKAKARQADNALTQWFAGLSDGTTSALAVANIAAVVGFGSYLGYKGVGLYERGRLDWKSVGLGLGVVGVVGIVESFLGGEPFSASFRSLAILSWRFEPKGSRFPDADLDADLWGHSWNSR
ncbi:Oxidoreductase [Diatrype stigma]|uniref:Mitochondrial intermembrane space import and assembly protein 40 n=1 Tax=Diatrype stigma TaxID=117547 RepID=A0AAN9UB37_9PEZI